PILDADEQPVAGFAVSIPRERFSDELVARATSVLHAHASRLSMALGYGGAVFRQDRLAEHRSRLRPPTVDVLTARNLACAAMEARDAPRGEARCPRSAWSCPAPPSAPTWVGSASATSS